MRTTTPKNAKPRLCIDCRFLLPYVGHPDCAISLATCTRSTPVVSAVDGTKRHLFCSNERDNTMPGHCGPFGSYFQAKP